MPKIDQKLVDGQTFMPVQLQHIQNFGRQRLLTTVKPRPASAVLGKPGRSQLGQRAYTAPKQQPPAQSDAQIKVALIKAEAERRKLEQERVKYQTQMNELKAEYGIQVQNLKAQLQQVLEETQQDKIMQENQIKQ